MKGWAVAQTPPPPKSHFYVYYICKWHLYSHGLMTTVGGKKAKEILWDVWRSIKKESRCYFSLVSIVKMSIAQIVKLTTLNVLEWISHFAVPATGHGEHIVSRCYNRAGMWCGCCLWRIQRVSEPLWVQLNEINEWERSCPSSLCCIPRSKQMSSTMKDSSLHTFANKDDF